MRRERSAWRAVLISLGSLLAIAYAIAAIGCASFWVRNSRGDHFQRPIGAGLTISDNSYGVVLGWNSDSKMGISPPVVRGLRTVARVQYWESSTYRASKAGAPGAVLVPIAMSAVPPGFVPQQWVSVHWRRALVIPFWPAGAGLFLPLSFLYVPIRRWRRGRQRNRGGFEVVVRGG
jgi:hypothetical protein